MRNTFPINHQAISKAITAAERRTSGEITCIITRQAGTYHHTPYAWALAVTVLASLGWLCYLTYGWQAAHASSSAIPSLAELLTIQLLAFTLTFSIVNLPSLRILLTPRSIKHAAARKLARQQFLARGLHLTPTRTGVLIFVAVAEHYAEIIADESIHKRVNPNVWHTTLGQLLTHIRNHCPTEGFVSAIESCATILARHFPHKKGSRNQIPNIIIQL